MRIPTLLALALIILAIAGASIFFFYRQNLTNSSSGAAPSNITVANITDQEATITWQTTDPTQGAVEWGGNGSLGNEQNDDRDKTNVKSHLTHYVTLTSLQGDATYYFKVKSNSELYPNNTLSFKTAKAVSTNQNLESFNKPLIGVVLSSNLEPIDEAIVTLALDGASPLSAFTTTAGNFIIPLLNLKTQDLSNSLVLDHQISGLLIAQRGDLRSEVKVALPLNSQLLPNIVLGQNSDFTHIGSTSATLPK